MKIDEALEMAYPQKVARDIIIGMSRPINQHLIKLGGFSFSPELRRHFKHELENWLDEIQRIRLKPTTRTGSFKFYFDPLFDYPFGGIEVQNMQQRCNLCPAAVKASSRRNHPKNWSPG